MGKIIHGHSKRPHVSKTYYTWRSMKERCLNTNNSRYKNYGGRGIRVCKKWMGFEGFLQDMGERPDGMTLDRIDNNGNYCQENCRWLINAEQQKNTKRTILITINNQTLCLKDWCQRLNLKYGTILARIQKFGWMYEEALEIVPRKRKTKSG